jgi:peptide/nickel transport system permease protein
VTKVTGLVARRVVTAMVVLVLASILVHLLVTALGDPLAELRRRNPPVPAEVIEARGQELGLDRSAPQRYLDWLGGAVQGDLGEDLDGRQVAPVVGRHLLVTLRLVVVAGGAALVLAVVVGAFSAVHQYSAGDHIATFTGFLLLSTPVFWVAALLKEHVAIWANQALGVQVLYTVGAQTPGLAGGFWVQAADHLGHLALPATALALALFAPWSRFQRAAILDALGSDHVRMARATGASSRRVLVRHVLRNALIPLTTVVAVDFSLVLGGAILVEEVFAWPGMGSLLVEGVTERDPNLVMGWLMVTGVVVVGCNLVADVVYAALDPRVRRG